MRPRILKTVPILTVALTASAPAPAAPHDNAQLEALKSELELTSPAKAIEKMSHFRPLCDKDGYPLVGNTIRKGEPEGMRPSVFCAEVRKREKKS